MNLLSMYKVWCVAGEARSNEVWIVLPPGPSRASSYMIIVMFIIFYPFCWCLRYVYSFSRVSTYNVNTFSITEFIWSLNYVLCWSTVCWDQGICCCLLLSPLLMAQSLTVLDWVRVACFRSRASVLRWRHLFEKIIFLGWSNYWVKIIFLGQGTYSQIESKLPFWGELIILSESKWLFFGEIVIHNHKRSF